MEVILIRILEIRVVISGIRGAYPHSLHGMMNKQDRNIRDMNTSLHSFQLSED